ncbi:hypothetical protein BT69DRAFT_1244723 [Atractiella rhizophila]|nr:hypothetical protein BT69DRAFT_1244723 [Atractiella rhizophila]
MPVLTPAPSPAILASKSLPDEPPLGSCPGDGLCNGKGGAPQCRGCPSFNNSGRLVPVSGPGSAEKRSNGMQTPEGSMSAEEMGEDQLMEDAEAGDSVSASSAAAPGKVAPMCCENCGTFNTPLWRRDGEGRVACNACGLYYKLHRKHRPVNMKRPVIKRRKRVPAANSASQSQTPKKQHATYTPYPPPQTYARQQTSSARLSPSSTSTSSEVIDPSIRRRKSPAAQQLQPEPQFQPKLHLQPLAQIQPQERRSPSNTLPELAAVASAMLPLHHQAMNSSNGMGDDDKERFKEELERSIGRAEEESRRLSRFLEEGRDLLRRLNSSSGSSDGVGGGNGNGEVRLSLNGRSGSGSGSLWPTSPAVVWDAGLSQQMQRVEMQS